MVSRQHGIARAPNPYRKQQSLDDFSKKGYRITCKICLHNELKTYLILKTIFALNYEKENLKQDDVPLQHLLDKLYVFQRSLQQ